MRPLFMPICMLINSIILPIMSQLIQLGYLGNDQNQQRLPWSREVHDAFGGASLEWQFQHRPGGQECSFGISLGAILRKANFHNSFADKDEVQKSFTQVRTSWSIRFKRQPNDAHRMNIRFLKDGRPASTFLNPNMQDLEDFSRKLNLQLTEHRSWMDINFESENSLVVKVQFKHELAEGIKETFQCLGKLTRKIYEHNYELKEASISSTDKASAIFGIEVHPSPLPNYVRETEQLPAKSSYNIRIIDNSSTIERTDDDTDYETMRCQIWEVDVKAHVQVTDSAELVDQTIDFVGIKKVGRREYYNGKQFVQMEVSNLYKMKNELSHRNIGSYYLQKKHNCQCGEDNLEDFMIAEKYALSFERFCRKLKVQNKRDFQKILVAIRQLLSGLCYLQDNHMIHCDIKGSNLMVDVKEKQKGFTVKIIDIGGMIRLTRNPRLAIEEEYQEDYRRELSTKGFFYQKEVDWYHPNFDMFGFGKTVQRVLLPAKPLEGILHSDYEGHHRELQSLYEECMKDPDELTGFRACRDRVDNIIFKVRNAR